MPSLCQGAAVRSHWETGKRTDGDDRSQETCLYAESPICGSRIDVPRSMFVLFMSSYGKRPERNEQTDWNGPQSFCGLFWIYI